MAAKTFYPTWTKEQGEAYLKNRRRNRSVTRFKRGAYNPRYNNDNRAFVPEIWAQESVSLLYEQMIYGATVHRDFEDEIARFGETVHTRKIGTFKAKRKQNDLDQIEEQPARSVDIPVVLNLRVQVSFIIGDGERSKSFQDLLSHYAEPAVMANASHLDRCIAGQAYQFLDNRAGGYGTLTPNTAHERLLDVRQMMNDKKVPEGNRWLGLASRSETIMQKADLFKSAERVGDDGSALRNASLGMKAGMGTFLSLNTPGVYGVDVFSTGASTTVATAPVIGGSTLVLTSASGFTVGGFIVVTGENFPQRITNISTNTLTLDRPFKNGAAVGAAVRQVLNGAVNQGSAIAEGDTTSAVSDGYPAGWLKEIVIDAAVPHVGQMVAFSAAGSPNVPFTPVYCIVEVDDLGGGNYAITLDRPLLSTIEDDDIVNLGPSGDHNFAYTRDAVALVNRPLALPGSGMGVLAGTGIANNMALRTTMWYDGSREGTVVTIGGLFGVAVLNHDLGGVLVS